MNSTKTQKPSNVLYESIFTNRSVDQIISTISKGIPIIIENAKGLLADATILNENNRYMTASFLGVTAREEISKIHIFIDACRLDIEKHTSKLKRLCKAFYNHIDKYAYYEIYSLHAINSMADAQEALEARTIKVCPIDPECDEYPDNRHSLHFQREMPLYVDFDDWAKMWYDPQMKRDNIAKLVRKFPIEDAEKELALVEKTHKLKLYSFRSLKTINDVFKKKYCGTSTANNEIIELYKETGDILEKNNIASFGDLRESSIFAWPLYDFV